MILIVVFSIYGESENISVANIIPYSSRLQVGFPFNILLVNPNTWRQANVPLIPFTSPYKQNMGSVPKFFVYNTSYLSSVIDQGKCGSCWAFSITNMMSDRISLAKLGRWKLNLSAQQIMECFKPNTACEGNSPEEAMKWIMDTQYKIKLASDYPYLEYSTTDVTGKCEKTKHGITIKEGSLSSVAEWIDEVNIDKLLLEKNILNMKLEIKNNGPIFAAITVYEDLYAYTGDAVYSHSKASREVGGHAIEIIGYCDKNIDTRLGIKDSEQGYWICRNSWGTNWPTVSEQKGYFLIRLGVNECGIESRVGAAVPSVSWLEGDRKKLYYNDFNVFKSVKKNLIA